jgi:thioredoxin
MIKHLTKEEFEQKVTNFSNDPNWKFEGEKPIIIKFSAKWCVPCKMLTPILEEIQKEYENKIKIYEVDTDDELELPMVFNIRSVPTMVFFPIGKNFFIKIGMMPASALKKVIEDELL